MSTTLAVRLVIYWISSNLGRFKLWSLEQR